MPVKGSAFWSRNQLPFRRARNENKADVRNGNRANARNGNRTGETSAAKRDAVHARHPLFWTYSCKQESIPASPDTARPGHLSGKGKTDETDEADGADETDELGELDELDETDDAVSRGGEKNFCKIFLELMNLSLPLYPQSDGLMPL